jgi:hypothetical protein
VATSLLEQCHRAGALELDVIGMSVNREDSRSGNAAVHCNLAFRRFSSALVILDDDFSTQRREGAKNNSGL